MLPIRLQNRQFGHIRQRKPRRLWIRDKCNEPRRKSNKVDGKLILIRVVFLFLVRINDSVHFSRIQWKIRHKWRHHHFVFALDTAKNSVYKYLSDTFANFQLLPFIRADRDEWNLNLFIFIFPQLRYGNVYRYWFDHIDVMEWNVRAPSQHDRLLRKRANSNSSTCFGPTLNEHISSSICCPRSYHRRIKSHNIREVCMCMNQK